MIGDGIIILQITCFFNIMRKSAYQKVKLQRETGIGSDCCLFLGFLTAQSGKHQNS